MSLRKPKSLKPRLGELLLSEGRISEETLTRALKLQLQDGRGTRLGAVLLKWDMLAEQDLLDALSRYHRCPSADRDTLAGADKKAVALLSSEQAARLNAMPYAFEDKAVRVAFTDPSNLAAVDEVKAITGRRVMPAVTSQVRLVQAHQRFYSRAATLDLWSVVQKLERKRRRAPAVAPAVPSDLAATFSAGAHDATDAAALSEGDRESAAPRTGAEGLVLEEPVEALPGPMEAFDTVAIGPVRVRAAGAGGERAREPDPFSDDCPLAKFVEDALSFFTRDADLRVALETFEEPVEELDPSTEEVTTPPPAREASGEPTITRTRPRSGPGLSY